jgi:hypothetical protein
MTSKKLSDGIVNTEPVPVLAPSATTLSFHSQAKYAPSLQINAKPITTTTTTGNFKFG